MKTIFIWYPIYWLDSIQDVSISLLLFLLRVQIKYFVRKRINGITFLFSCWRQLKWHLLKRVWCIVSVPKARAILKDVVSVWKEKRCRLLLQIYHNLFELILFPFLLWLRNDLIRFTFSFIYLNLIEQMTKLTFGLLKCDEREIYRFIPAVVVVVKSPCVGGHR